MFVSIPSSSGKSITHQPAAGCPAVESFDPFFIREKHHAITLSHEKSVAVSIPSSSGKSITLTCEDAFDILLRFDPFFIREKHHAYHTAEPDHGGVSIPSSSGKSITRCRWLHPAGVPFRSLLHQGKASRGAERSRWSGARSFDPFFIREKHHAASGERARVDLPFRSLLHQGKASRSDELVAARQRGFRSLLHQGKASRSGMA